MDPIGNPYTPGAGMAPSELAGRDHFRQIAHIAIERLRRGLPAKNLLMLGVRGVGKTVLLDRIRNDAQASGIPSLRLEASGQRSLPSLLAPELRLMLLRWTRDEQSREGAIRALRALAGFAGAMKTGYPDLEVGLDYEPESGLADSGTLQQDLLAVFESVGTAALRSQTAAVLFIDDLHFLSAAELMALTTTLQRCNERNLPIALLGTGLPQLRSLVAEIGAHAERLFEFLELGPLSAAAATQAVRKPAAELNVEFEEDAIANILSTTQCYPYFLQELAKQAWDAALQSPITLQDTRNGAHLALAALDEKFFRLRFDRLSRAERKYIRAMAELGPGPHRSGEIAAVLNRPVTSVGPTRSHLTAKGLIWSPGHGETAFAVPRFDEFLRRTWPGDSWRN